MLAPSLVLSTLYGSGHESSGGGLSRYAILAPDGAQDHFAAMTTRVYARGSAEGAPPCAQQDPEEAGVDFWTERVRRYGHTGWCDPVIYDFEQRARLYTVARRLATYAGQKDVALDFGTGTGDFARLLACHYRRVVAFDPCVEVVDLARRKHAGVANIEFRQAPSVAQLDLADEGLDLILSVTVLDHILDDSELDETLARLARKLKPGGRLLALEYAVNADESAALALRKGNAYQRFSPLGEWRERLGRHGLSVERLTSFHDPYHNPAPSWERYRKSLVRRAAHRLGWRAVEGLCAQLLILSLRDLEWAGERPSLLKLMDCRKGAGA